MNKCFAIRHNKNNSQQSGVRKLLTQYLRSSYGTLMLSNYCLLAAYTNLAIRIEVFFFSYWWCYLKCVFTVDYFILFLCLYLFIS